MWRHITGVEQPAKKKIKLDNNQDDGDAGDDDVSSDDNTNILSSL